MKSFLKLLILTLVFSSLFLLVSRVFAAAPDGLGPWADTVVSFHQGVMKNGLPVPAARSDSTAALGVAENTPTIDSTFFSLGFGGNIVLGLDNGISSGALIVEATIEPGYPDETAKVEMSQDGVNWTMAGNVKQTGTVQIPDQIDCAKFVRITDTSIPSNYPDAIADGYDVDGVKATGEPCTISPTPSITPTSVPSSAPTITETPASTSTPTPTNTPSSGGGGTSSNTTSSNSPGFPNAGSCTSTGTPSVPGFTLARRLSPTSIFVSWSPSSGASGYIVEYGFQNGNWQFNTKVTGSSITINDLPANQSIWIRVAATDNCGAIGNFGGAVLVGGTIFTNSPGFPNTGNPLIPGLPNTGIGPNDNNLIWIIPGGILLSFGAIYLFRRKYKFL